MEPSKEEPPVIYSELRAANPSFQSQRPAVRQPNVFNTGDDFELWVNRMKFFLRDVPQHDLMNYVLSYLSDAAARQLMSCKLPPSASAETIWSCLHQLFGDSTPSEVYLDRFYQCVQLPDESVRTYLGRLRELATRAFPTKTGPDLNDEICRRFRLGVRSPELRSKFLRKPALTLGDAVRIATSYESVDQLCGSFGVNTIQSSSSSHQAPARTPTAPGRRNCPYCARFGRRAQRCGHNPPIRRARNAGESPIEILIPFYLLTCCSNMNPLTLLGTVRGRRTHILVDTGATCSIVNPRVAKEFKRAPTPNLTLITAAGTRVPVQGKVSMTIDLVGRSLSHDFLVAPVKWDIIVGTDFLATHNAVINVRKQRVAFGDADVSSELCAQTEVRETPAWTEQVMDGPHVNNPAKSSVISILHEFSDVFDVNRGSLGRTRVLQHAIDTGEHRPIRQPCRRVPVHQQAELERMLREMLDKKIIRPSSSPWASPIVLVSKKDGSLRLCIDYRRLNSVTERDSFPLPRIDATLDAVGGSKYFSTLDLASGYWQVEVAPKDRAKTAFVVPSGLYEFETMPFGLANAPATFQRLMQRVLDSLIPQACLVYLDDIIVHGKTIEEHNERLREVLTRLRAAGLTLKTNKCKFLRNEVFFLGHKLSALGVEVDDGKIERIVNWPTPTSPNEVRSFLGLASYYRKYVRGFAAIAAPLHRLTEKGRVFVWTNECATAFSTLKTRLTTPPILAYPDVSPAAGHFILDTDASDLAIGAVLSQVQDGQERVIAYASRSLDKRERRYCTTRREMLALVYFLKHFRPYLLGRQFVVRTDHHSLQWLQHFKDPLGQIARWQEQLQEYHFVCQYRRGAQHGNADALSRQPAAGQNEVSVCQLASDHQQWADCQENDPQLQFIYRRQTSGGPKPSGTEMRGQHTAIRCLWNLWSKIILVDGVMYLRNSDDTPLRLIVPQSMVQQVIARVHADLGHAGVRKTEAAVRRRFWWPLLHNDVTVFCQQCDTCQRIKSLNPQPRAPLQPLAIEGPNHRVGVDLMGPLPASKSGNRYILVMVDYFTKWCEAVPLQQPDALSVADAIFRQWICRFGAPLFIHSDQGSAFENQLLKAICNLLHITKTRTTPYHPQGNGLVERTNRTLKRILQAVVDRDHADEWDKNLAPALLAYRAAQHSSTGFSPAYLRLGQELRLPDEIHLPMVPAEAIDMCSYVQRLRQQLTDAFQQTRQSILYEQQHQKTCYDRNARGPQYQKGDLVLLYRPRPTPGTLAKFHRPWQGPYIVVYQRTPTVFVIRDCQRPNADVLTVHYNQLKPYRAPATQTALVPTPSTSIPQPPASYVEVPAEGGSARPIAPRSDPEDSVSLVGGINCNGIETHKVAVPHLTYDTLSSSCPFIGKRQLYAIRTDDTDEEATEKDQDTNTDRSPRR